MNRMRLCLLLLLNLSMSAYAKEDVAPELATRIDQYHVDYTLDNNATAVMTQKWAMTVLKESAVADAKTTSIGYSTSIEKAEVIEAYTRKADGRRIDSAPSNFQVESNSGKGKDAPVFSDRTTLTVVFPEVAVGDTVVFSYRITQSEPMFPKHFSIMETFPRGEEFHDVEISIDAPSALWTQYEVHDLKEVENSDRKGRKVLRWTYENKNPVKNARRDYSVYDYSSEPGLMFSTFKSYKEIVEAYGQRARPKATVTPRIQKLADSIIDDKATPEVRARALYDWTAKNISYAGNCIGTGAVVPHDIDFILDNRMGDCKDHATLLQALLSAKGIASTQALINAGSGYRLPKVPVVSYVNHVINYIPSLNQYADSTSEVIPFGMLPKGDIGKPVLWVDGFQDGTRTPTPTPGSNQQHIVSAIKINDDGSVTGSIDVSLKGLYAIGMRAAMQQLTKDRESEFVEGMFRRMGHVGSGTINRDDSTELTDSFHYKVDFKVNEYVQWPGTGAFAIFPPFYTPAPVAHYLAAAAMQVESVEVACSNGNSDEEYRYELPNKMKVLSVPGKASQKNDFLAYDASYELNGNVLVVKRAFDDRTPDSTCSPKMMESYKDFARGVLPNVKAQVLYTDQ